MYHVFLYVKYIQYLYIYIYIWLSVTCSELEPDVTQAAGADPDISGHITLSN